MITPHPRACCIRHSGPSCAAPVWRIDSTGWRERNCCARQPRAGARLNCAARGRIHLPRRFSAP